MTDHDRAQLAALGARCARCGTPAHPSGGHGYTSAGYACPPPDGTATLRAALHEAVGLLEQLDAYHPAEHCDSCAMIRAALNGEARPSGAEMERDALRAELARVTAEREELAKRCEWFRAAHMLAAQEHLFLAPKPQGGPFMYNGASLAVYEGEPALWVNCGDTFAWGCADAEAAEYADAPEILRLGVAEGWPGITRWVQARRVAREEPAECIPQVKELIASSDAVRAELARTEQEARTALDALHARVDAAERAAETARAEEREAWARVCDEAATWRVSPDARAMARTIRGGGV